MKRERTISQEEFGNKIYVPVSATTVGGGDLVSGQVELGIQVFQWCDGRALAAVVLVLIHVQHFLAANGQHPTDDAFLITLGKEIKSKNNNAKAEGQI